MNCREVGRHLPGYLEGIVAQSQRVGVQAHLDSCVNCRETLNAYRRLATALANVAPVAPPADLMARIRTKAAHARSEGSLARRVWRRTAMVFENILEPLAIPATGGVLTAMVAFLFVVQGILVGMPVVSAANDLPTSLMQPARLESLGPFPVPGITDGADPSGAELLIVEATLNQQGQVVSYNILAGPTDAALRRQLDQLLLFSRFRPQISFGRPTAGGRVVLNFSEVRVRG
jgi:Putative zinc-finger